MHTPTFPPTLHDIFPTASPAFVISHLDLSRSDGGEMKSQVVLICISLIAKDQQHFLMHFSTFLKIILLRTLCLDTDLIHK